MIPLTVEQFCDLVLRSRLHTPESMQAIARRLRAERDGIIGKIRVKPGDSVAVDAVIMEFV